MAGEGVELTGAESTDLDGEIVAWEWRQTSGVSVALSGAGTSRATFAMPAGEGVHLDFELKVTDDQGAQSTAQTQVTGAQFSIDDSGGGSAGLLIVILIMCRAVARYLGGGLLSIEGVSVRAIRARKTDSSSG